MQEQVVAKDLETQTAEIWNKIKMKAVWRADVF